MTYHSDELNKSASPLENDFSYEGSFSDLLASLGGDFSDVTEAEEPAAAEESDLLGSIFSELYPEELENTSEAAPAPVGGRAQEAVPEPAAKPVAAAAPAEVIPEPTEKPRKKLSESDTAPAKAAPAKSAPAKPKSAPKKSGAQGDAAKGKSAEGGRKKSASSPAEQKGEKKSGVKPGGKAKAPSKGGKPKKKSAIAPEDVYNEENWVPFEVKLKRSKVKFIIGLAVYLVIFIAAAAVGVVCLNGYMNSYEQSRPEYFMEAIMPTMTANDWYNLMLENAHIEASEFESIDDIYEAYYNAIVTSEDISYRKKLGLYSDEQPVYSVRIGATDIVNIYLTPDETGDAGYGFNYWKLDHVEALADGTGLTSATVEIDAPADAELYLNGVLLSGSYIVDEQVPYTLSELESRFDTQPYKVKYRVEGLYLNYDIRDGSGNQLDAYKQEGGSYYYNIDQAERWSFKVTAMSDMTVTVNGAQLSNDDAVKTDSYSVLSGIDKIDKYVDSIPTVNTWSYSNLLTEPVITCVDANGETLTPTILDDGAYVFSYSPSAEAEEDFSERALGFLNAYIKYATDDGNATDSNYYKLVQYVLADSELREYFYSSYLGGMHWGGIKDYELHEVRVSDFIMHGDSCFSCTGYFSITQETYYETRNYETTYTLVFVKSGNSWYVVRMDDSGD